jgi:hypothetical protein
MQLVLNRYTAEQTNSRIFQDVYNSSWTCHFGTTTQLNLSLCIKFVQDAYVTYQCEQRLRTHPGHVHLRTNRQLHLFCMYTIRPGRVHLSTNNRLNLSACMQFFLDMYIIYASHRHPRSPTINSKLAYPRIHFIRDASGMTDKQQLNVYIGVHKFILGM